MENKIIKLPPPKAETQDNRKPMSEFGRAVFDMMNELNKALYLPPERKTNG